MTTKSFVPRSELIDWLRGSVRRRENVVLKIITEPQQETITLRLSEGRLIYVHCEGHGPLEALFLLSECEQVKFGYSSVRVSERRELMSPEALLKWLDSASGEVAGAFDAHADRSSPAPDDERWSGTLRGGRVRKGKAPVVVAVVATVALIVASRNLWSRESIRWSRGTLRWSRPLPKPSERGAP